MARIDLLGWALRLAQAIFGLPPVPALLPVKQEARATRRRH
jgi:hypothetical protein